MGLITPTTQPPACPACVNDLPANLNGSMEMDPFGEKVFVFVQDGVNPERYLAIIAPPFGGIGQVAAWFCSPGDRLRLLVGAAMDPAELDGNNCDLPAEGTTTLGWLIKIWE